MKYFKTFFHTINLKKYKIFQNIFSYPQFKRGVILLDKFGCSERMELELDSNAVL